MHKKTLAALLLAVLMLCTACGTDPLPQDTAEPADTEETPVLQDTYEVPHYLIADPEETRREAFTCPFGYWNDDTAYFWIESETVYNASALAEDTPGTVKSTAMRICFLDSTRINYLVTVPDITEEEAKAGIVFAGETIRFVPLPEENISYVNEFSGMRITLTPLNEDFSVFGYKLHRIGYHDAKYTIVDKLVYQYPTYNVPISKSMFLVTETARTYPLTNFTSEGVQLLGTERVPNAKGTAIRGSNMLINAKFEESEGALLSVPLPAEGTVTSEPMDFTFPDGMKGRIVSVGYNALPEGLTAYWGENEYPMGFLSMKWEFLEQDGIYCEYGFDYSHEYLTHADKELEKLTEGKYSMDRIGRYAYHTIGTPPGLRQFYAKTMPYFPTGESTVELTLRYRIILNGNWGFSFTEDHIARPIP